jgi:hypothetical protein
VRTKSTAYVDCDACIDANPCPLNFKIQGCCGGDGEIFSAALIGVNVGDTFVDTNGFCWSAIDTTPNPITNVVEVGTVYPITNCESNVCRDLNECPTPVFLESCCGLTGYSTLELLQATLPTLVLGDTFVDTFGICWVIKLSDYAFPNLSFIVPVTEYGLDNCIACTLANECPRDVYYTIQNCCTEEIEVVLLNASYNVGERLLLTLDIGVGCYKVLSWSITGTITATVSSVLGISGSCDQCLNQMKVKFNQVYCPGQYECCNSYINDSASTANITGYKCDGTWLNNYAMAVNEVICMAFVVERNEFIINQGCCKFDIYNPSATQSIEVNFDTCETIGISGAINIPPLTTFTEAYFAATDKQACLRCVYGSKGVWEYLPCPFT